MTGVTLRVHSPGISELVLLLEAARTAGETTIGAFDPGLGRPSAR
jgi:thiamine biosynthesis lipoprotein ApbE